MIYDGRDRSFLEASSSILKSGGHSLFISENDDFLSDPTDQNRIDLTHAALDEVPIRLDEVRGRIARASTGLGPDLRIVVDMRWGLKSVSDAANFERWGELYDRITGDAGQALIERRNFAELDEASRGKGGIERPAPQVPGSMSASVLPSVLSLCASALICL